MEVFMVDLEHNILAYSSKKFIGGNPSSKFLVKQLKMSTNLHIFLPKMKRFRFD